MKSSSKKTPLRTCTDGDLVSGLVQLEKTDPTIARLRDLLVSNSNPPLPNELRKSALIAKIPESSSRMDARSLSNSLVFSVEGFRVETSDVVTGLRELLPLSAERLSAFEVSLDDVRDRARCIVEHGAVEKYEACDPGWSNDFGSM